MVSSPGNKIADNQPATPHSTKQANAAAPSPTHLSTRLSSAALTNLLAGEFSLQRGKSESAAQHLLKAAQLTQDTDTAKRATYAAQFGHNKTLLNQTSHLWSTLDPHNPLPWQYLAQAHSLNGDFDAATLALYQEISLDGGAGLAYVASLSLNESMEIQSKLKHHYQTWLKTHPQNHQLLYSLAVLSQGTHSQEDALKHVLAALKIAPNYLQAQVFYGEQLLESQQYQAADSYLTTYTANLTRAPRHLITLHAQVLTLMASYTRAYALFEELSRRFPNDLSFRYSAGLLAYENKSYGLATKHLQHILTLGPLSGSAHYYLGLINLHLQLPELAVSHFQRVAQGPDQLAAATHLLDLLEPEIMDAAVFFEQLRLGKPNIAAELFNLEAQYFLDHDAFDKSNQAYTAGINAHPNHVALLYGKALLAQTQSQYQLSEQLLEQVISLEPEHINALNALGYTYADQGIKLPLAEKLIRRALMLAPESPAIIDSLGWVIYRQGHLRQAYELLKQAHELLPDPEIAAHLGLVQWALGDIEGAYSTWNAAFELDPNNALIKQAILDAQNEFQNN